MSDNENSIYDAAVFGEFDRVEALLADDPALVNETDEDGFTPLHGVVGEDHFDMAQLLIGKGADVNAANDEGVTPLHLAAYPEMVEILVNNGANLEARDAAGATPLHTATEHPELLDVMEKLLELGADVHAEDDSGQNAMDIALALEDDEKAEVLGSYGGRATDAQ